MLPVYKTGLKLSYKSTSSHLEKNRVSIIFSHVYYDNNYFDTDAKIMEQDKYDGFVESPLLRHSRASGNDKKLLN